MSPRQEHFTQVVALSPYWAADGLAQASVGWVHRAASFRLGFVLGAEWALARTRYMVQAAPTDQLVFEPFRVRPFAELELAVP